jgi:putative exosortase-associated protein (TIGR04073 family)
MQAKQHFEAVKKSAAVFLLSLIFLTPNLWAQEAPKELWEAADSPEYGRKFTGMLGRGLLNMGTCFVDLLVQTVEGTKAGPPVVGTLTGLGGGIACTALRVTSGALDVLTFWVPGFNGIPVGRSYKNCLEMEEETLEPAVQEAVPPAAAPGPEYYAKPAGKPDVMEYVKK